MEQHCLLHYAMVVVRHDIVKGPEAPSLQKVYKKKYAGSLETAGIAPLLRVVGLLPRFIYPRIQHCTESLHHVRHPRPHCRVLQKHTNPAGVRNRLAQNSTV